MKPVDRLLPLLEGVKPTGDSRWKARCPAHDDRDPSLSVTEVDDRVLLKCFAGCPTEDIVEKLGLEMGDLFAEKSNGRREIVATYDYVDEAGELLFQVVRSEGKQFLQRRPDGKGGWVWKLGDTRRVPYRLPRVLAAVKRGEGVFVVEGERDVHALEGEGLVATCNSGGAGKWRQEHAEPLRGAEVVVVADRDEPGRRHATQVAASLQDVAATVDVVEPAVGKDISDHLAAGKSVGLVVEVDEDSGSTPSDTRATAQQSRELAREPRILDRLRAALASAGLVGEDEAAEILYLATTSRLLEKPVSVAVKGPSAGGKSFLVETVLAFLPDSAYYAMTGMSDRALAYSQEPLEHRMLVIYEAAGMTGEFATYLLRSLLSEGAVRYETVEKTKEGVRARLIERPGPTGLIVTTTQVRLHPENETRLLSIPVTDTPEQTKSVMLAVAGDDRPTPDLLPWIGLQEMIAGGERRVVIPFAKGLAELVPPAAVRLRRDFAAVLGLVKAHALLHGASRSRDEHGRIVATIEDYAVVNKLASKLVSDGIGVTVRPETRATVAAVVRLADDHSDGVPQSALVRELRIDRSAVSRRVRVAIDGGYLRNLEERKGRPHRLIVGDPLPDDLEILPSPETLSDCCTVARASGGIDRAGEDRLPT